MHYVVWLLTNQDHHFFISGFGYSSACIKLKSKIKMKWMEGDSSIVWTCSICKLVLSFTHSCTVSTQPFWMPRTGSISLSYHLTFPFCHANESPIYPEDTVVSKAPMQRKKKWPSKQPHGCLCRYKPGHKLTSNLVCPQAVSKMLWKVKEVI